MRVCLMIEGQEGVAWDQWTALGAACEEHGFDALFRSDHYLSFYSERQRGTLDAWATVSALAAVTHRIRLGTLVSPATFRHPAVLAKTAVSADHVSGGRIEVGMGAGWYEREHVAFGFPFAEVGERMEVLAEQVEIVHRLWDRDEESVTFDGRHYRLASVPALPKAVQDPHPPLILGGQGGPRSLRLAARWADEYNVHGKPPETCREIRGRLDAACEAAGRDPDAVSFSLMTGALIGSDERELERRAARVMDRTGGSGDPASFLAARGPGLITGTPDRVVEQLAVFADAGVRGVMLQHWAHEDLETIALVGREIIPEVAGL